MVTIQKDYEFKTLDIEYKQAYLCVAKINYEGIDGQNYATIYSLKSCNKKDGEASALMDYVCSIADQYNITLELQALATCKDIDSLTQEHLLSFYRRKGFVFEDKAGELGEIKGTREPVIKDMIDDSLVDFFNHQEYEEED